MTDDFSKIDPLFAAPPGQTAPPPNNDEQEGNPLTGLDPIFENPIGPSVDASKGPPPSPPSDYTPEVIGGVTGAVIGSRAPKYENPKLSSARSDYAGAQASEGSLKGELTRMQGNRLDAVDNARLTASDAQAEVNMARQELNAAEEAARKLNALPEPVASSSATEAAVKGSSNVEGALSQGALKHSEKMGEVREANQVRKGIAGYRQGLPSTERVPLTGYTQSSRLIVPNELANAPVKSAAQIEAENRLQVAKDNHAAAVKRAADARVQQESASRPTRAETTLSSDVTKASSTTAGRKAALEELEKARSFLSKIPGFNTIMGGLSGAELVHAYRELEAGNTLEGVMAGLSGVGGLISMVPHPVAKAVGTAMTLPPLAYQGYKAYKNYQTPEEAKP